MLIFNVFLIGTVFAIYISVGKNAGKKKVKKEKKMTVFAPHKVDLNDEMTPAITSYMLEHGTPTIRVVDCGDHHRAVEGSHRLAIAARLGLTPNLEIVDEKDLATDYDIEFCDIYNGVYDNTDLTIDVTWGNIIDYLSSTVDFNF